MKTSLRRAGALSFAVAAAPWARAHPGHDGHELTWDFSHLAEHPYATLGCVALAGAAVFVLVRLIRRPAVLPAQSFRGSHASRGK